MHSAGLIFFDTEYLLLFYFALFLKRSENFQHVASGSSSNETIIKLNRILNQYKQLVALTHLAKREIISNNWCDYDVKVPVLFSQMGSFCLQSLGQACKSRK